MIVWYDKKEDQIFCNGTLDGLFFALQPISFYYPELTWDRFEILDFMKDFEVEE